MWTQAPCSWAIGMSSANGSNAPVFTLPACVHTMVGPSIAGEGLAQGVGAHPSLAVGRDLPDLRPFPSEPEHLERGVDRDVGAATTFSGDIENEMGPTPTRQSRWTTEKELSFSLAGGGAKITVQTLSGNIRLRKRP